MILMHGDRSFPQRNSLAPWGFVPPSPCARKKRRKQRDIKWGYLPVWHPHSLPRVWEQTILDPESVWVNGGKRGFLVNLHPRAFVEVLSAIPVSVARSSA